MIDVLVFSLLVILGLASPGNSGLSPEFMYDSGLLRKEPPSCREPTLAEKKARALEPKGKAATFSLDGEFLCEREIFTYGERDSYADFTLQQAGLRAPAVARQAAALADSEPQLKDRQWSVEVIGAPQELRAHLRTVYQAELAKALGEGRVVRGHAEEGSARLHVGLRPVQDADLLFDVSVVVTTGKDGKDLNTWRL